MDKVAFPERDRHKRAASITRCLRLLAGAVLACTAVSAARAQEPTLGVFSQREQWIAAFEQLPEPALRAIFLRCDRESRERVLQFDEGVRCALAWDALLKRGFTNDVGALLAWWKDQRDSTTTQVR